MSVATVAVFALIVWRFRERETEPEELADGAPVESAAPALGIAERWHKRNKGKGKKKPG
jgi:hypothetical protein